MNEVTRQMELLGWSWDSMAQLYKYLPIPNLTLSFNEAKRLVLGGSIKSFTTEKVIQHAKVIKQRKLLAKKGGIK